VPPTVVAPSQLPWLEQGDPAPPGQSTQFGPQRPGLVVMKKQSAERGQPVLDVAAATEGQAYRQVAHCEPPTHCVSLHCRLERSIATSLGLPTHSDVVVLRVRLALPPVVPRVASRTRLRQSRIREFAGRFAGTRLLNWHAATTDRRTWIGRVAARTQRSVCSEQRTEQTGPKHGRARPLPPVRHGQSLCGRS
jgi:hypothetical protein